MTQRDFYNAIASFEKTEETAELIEFATAAIAKMDAANEKRRNTPSKTQEANAPLMNQILNEVLTVSPITASDVATAIGVSVQKASGLLRILVKDEKVVQTEGKVPKKGTVKLYALPSDNCDECEING